MKNFLIKSTFHCTHIKNLSFDHRVGAEFYRDRIRLTRTCQATSIYSKTFRYHIYMSYTSQMKEILSEDTCLQFICVKNTIIIQLGMLPILMLFEMSSITTGHCDQCLVLILFCRPESTSYYFEND